jgi:dienelactone hydrolase
MALSLAMKTPLSLAIALATSSCNGHGLPRAAVLPSFPGVTSHDFDYTFEGKPYTGYWAYPTAPGPDPLPFVLVAHQWKGLGPMEKYRSEQLASRDYVAFALDVYGTGIRPGTDAEAKANMTIVLSDVPKFHAMLSAAVSILEGGPAGMKIKQQALFANGYCFGGKMVLELARIGTPHLLGVSSFHGELDNSTSQSNDAIQAAVQVHHADGDFQGAQGLLDFEDEMRIRNVTVWSTTKYGQCVHGWTDPTSQAYMPFQAAQATTAMFSFYEQLVEPPASL